MVMGWLILFLPLAAFLLIPLTPERNRAWAGWLACLSIGVSFLLSLKLALPLFRQGHLLSQELSIEWI